jgi:hypothetical protein
MYTNVQPVRRCPAGALLSIWFEIHPDCASLLLDPNPRLSDNAEMTCKLYNISFYNLQVVFDCEFFSWMDWFF